MQRELVERAIGGDHDAFSILVRRVASPGCMPSPTSSCATRDRAQDAVQEALVSPGGTCARCATPTRGMPGSTGSPCGPAIEWPQKERRRTWSSCTSMPDPEPATRLRHDRHSRWERDRSSGSSADLPIDQRAVIVLHFYLDLPLTEAADILDIPVGTAKSRLNRGLACPARASMRAESSDLAGARRAGANGMNDDRAYERLFAEGLTERSLPRARPPARLRPIKSTTGRMRPRPRWLALIKEPPMRISSRVAVGSPTARLAAILAATLLLAVLATGAVVAGGTLLAGPAPIVVAQDGSGSHQTIAEAVAAATDGDTIRVRPGTYPEAVVVDKDIAIRAIRIGSRGDRRHVHCRTARPADSRLNGGVPFGIHSRDGRLPREPVGRRARRVPRRLW